MNTLETLAANLKGLYLKSCQMLWHVNSIDGDTAFCTYVNEDLDNPIQMDYMCAVEELIDDDVDIISYEDFRYEVFEVIERLILNKAK